MAEQKKPAFWLVVYLALGVVIGGAIGLAFCLIALGEIDGLLLGVAITVGVVKAIIHWLINLKSQMGAFEKKNP